ncbi:hypothetical protein R5R35_000487 [Gryllus longicercus]|uniref:Peptidase S1 domain-containing protein n=1 Tax=Gryllus longicercus TaxID=2509291 RepID=A0AAN9Z131_9ORTH
MKAQLQLVWAVTVATAAWGAAVAAEAPTAAPTAGAAAAAAGAAGVAAARRGGPLLWATASESAAAGAGEGCAAVLLSPSWALLSTRCLKGAPPYHLTLVAPEADGAPVPAGAGAGPDDGGWRQRRRVVKVARHANQADAGALEFPGLALARVDRPFTLGAALRPAPVLAGALDDARRPLRCSIEGWKVQKQSAPETAADLANFTEPIKTTIGVVLTHEQCRAHALVEQPAQFCVEAPAQPRLQDGGALLCAGALVGVHYSATRYNTSLASFFHLFTNASDLQLWLGIHVPALKLVSSNGDGALVDLAPKHGSVAKSAGAVATQALFLPAAAAAAAAAALVLWRQFALVRL